MRQVISDPAEIFAKSFPPYLREQILTEARKHLVELVPELAEKSFAQLPVAIQTRSNRTAMELAARETVKLRAHPPETLAGTIRILRAWIVKLEITDGPTPGSTKAVVAYRKA